MMQPTPPQGAPDQAPPQGAPAGEGAASALIKGIQSDMHQLGSLLEKAGVGGPDAMQEYAGILASFENFIQELTTGQEDDDGAKPEPSGAGSVEAGSNPNARPM